MAEYITQDAVQTVALNTAIPFLDSIPCRKGYVYHQSGTGIFVLRGIVNNPQGCFARYEVKFTGNISIPENGAVTPIATAIPSILAIPQVNASIVLFFFRRFFNFFS